MQIRQLEIRRFRGIECLDWMPGQPIACLIGPGDSTKSTILDAIECVLSPQRHIAFSDADFYNLQTDQAFEIAVTVGNLPPLLITEDRFGLYLRGWGASGLVDEPDDDHESVLTIRLSVGQDLEPTWTVVTDRNSEGVPISAQNRAKFGVARLGAEVSRHLTWGWGSALSRLTEDPTGAKTAITGALRAAREAAAESNLGKLISVASRAQKRSRVFGVRANSVYRPALDPHSVSISNGVIALHDGGIPLRTLGTGSQRLTALAIQHMCVAEGAILLVDEIEHGLEPHRIRHFLRVLKSEIGDGQVIATSHSPTVLFELDAPEICAVRSIAGCSTVRQIPSELQPAIRACPEAPLSRGVIVCEGQTEVGFCRAIDSLWTERHNNIQMHQLGVVPVSGGGSHGPQRAIDFARLGYRVAFFADSDVDAISPDEQAVHEAGVEVVRWNGGMATELRVFHDLPWEYLTELISIAIAHKGLHSVVQSVANTLRIQAQDLGDDFTKWSEIDGKPEQEIRAALGTAAKSDKWFKTFDLGKELGSVVARSIPEIPSSDLAIKLNQLGEWVHGDNAPAISGE